MNIIIIGSKGFIGSHITNFLTTKNRYTVYEADVVVSDNCSNYFQLDSLNTNYQYLFEQVSFSVCINCSGAANVSNSFENPLPDFTLNTYNVFKILEAIRVKQPMCKFINLSSAAVYGNPQKLPIMENSNTFPISPYGNHKLYAEDICKEFNLYYEIPTCSLRIFSAYGIGLRKQLFWDLFQKASTSNTIELFGSGKESRDFIYIDDVVKAVFLCLENSEFKGETINIANGKQLTIEHVVNIFLSFFPGKKKANFNGIIKEGDPLFWEADISTLEGLGYKTSTEITEGLSKYFYWVNKL